MISKSVVNGTGLIIGNNVKFFGKVCIGANCTIEDNVIIGHPIQNDIDEFRKKQGKYDFVSYENLNESISTKITIGDNCTIRNGSIIYTGVVIGKNVICSHNVIIREGSSVGNNTYIKNNAEIFTDVLIGDECRIAGIVSDRVRIGNNVSSLGVLIHSYRNPVGGLKEPAPVLKDRCVVGRNAIIIGDVEIGEGAYIAAGAIVTKDVVPNKLIKSSVATIIHDNDLSSS
ncbi:MAG: hypothetical protein MJA29_11080 [Candidatus Omnitrophica bacterium]|nr:hypothetical protein [Candidatus Omnitrophota bacterium]